MVFRKIFPNSARDMVHAVSMDNGKSFSSPQTVSPDEWVINGCPHVGPDMVSTGQELHFVWFTKGGIYRTTTQDNGVTFAPRTPVVTERRASHPQITALKNGTVVLVWDEQAGLEAKARYRVGVQRVFPDGKSTVTHVDAPTDAERPAVMALNNGTVFLAFTHVDEHHSEIVYQIN